MQKRILFQGDSITDCSRNREDFYSVGNGYAALVKEALNEKYPEEFECINQGRSGERLPNLYVRMEEHIILLKPDFLSIYTGVNDAWRESDKDYPPPSDRFERLYRLLLDEVTTYCPNTKIMLIAPYLLEGTFTRDTLDAPTRFAHFKECVALKAEATKKIAKEYGFPCIDLQQIFDDACEKEPTETWSVDGVHPTIKGHELIKNAWLTTFETMI